MHCVRSQSYSNSAAGHHAITYASFCCWLRLFLTTNRMRTNNTQHTITKIEAVMVPITQGAISHPRALKGVYVMVEKGEHILISTCESGGVQFAGGDSAEPQ